MIFDGIVVVDVIVAIVDVGVLIIFVLGKGGRFHFR